MFRQLPILLFGAVLSAVISIYATLSSDYFLENKIAVPITSFLILVFLALWGLGVLYKLKQKIIIWLREDSLLKIKIGILNDIKWEEADKGWSDISPDDWIKLIHAYAKERNLKVNIRKIDKDVNFNSFSAIINPYAGIYPEKDVVKFETLNKIFNYVKEGGTFVNVADIPGYYVYNNLLNRHHDSNLPEYNKNKSGDIEPSIPFDKTPFINILKLKVRGIRENVTLTINNKFIVERCANVENNMNSILTADFPNNQKVSPLFYLRYGSGRFVISMLNLTLKENKKDISDHIVQMMFGGIKKRPLLYINKKNYDL